LLSEFFEEKSDEENKLMLIIFCAEIFGLIEKNNKNNIKKCKKMLEKIAMLFGLFDS
jgi:hypothetical protein